MTAFRAAFKAYRMHQVLILPRFARLTFALGLITVGVAIHLTAINGSISIRRLNVTLFRYAHG